MEGVLPTAGGVVYTRWGKTICPGSADLVYSGFAAKSRATETGGGINFQCLPSTNPDYLDYAVGNQVHRAKIYGVEYEVWESDGPLRAVQFHGVPCAVCFTSLRGASLMIPAKTVCPNGWTREYYGYLMAERSAHVSPSTYECIDMDPDSLPATGANLLGGIFMHVETPCLTHLCPPYKEGMELTCVVCTK